jgi:hypothetical protein
VGREKEEGGGLIYFRSTVAIGLGTSDIKGKELLPGWKEGYSLLLISSFTLFFFFFYYSLLLHSFSRFLLSIYITLSRLFFLKDHMATMQMMVVSLLRHYMETKAKCINL